MKQRSFSKTLLASAVVLALASASVQAGAADKTSKEQKIGMLTGTTAGAIVGGPFGAAIGFIVGTIAGTGANDYNTTKKTAQSLEQQLASAQAELAKLAAAHEEEKSANDAKLETVYSQFAQRLHADVLFRTASAELETSSIEKLADLGKVLGAYPDLVIDIDGYADPRGKSISNDELSQQRAMAVRAALIVGGASPDRINVSAHGAKLSTATKDDLEAYAWERRVSLSVRPSSSTNQVAQTK